MYREVHTLLEMLQKHIRPFYFLLYVLLSSIYEMHLIQKIKQTTWMKVCSIVILFQLEFLGRFRANILLKKGCLQWIWTLAMVSALLDKNREINNIQI